MDKQWFYAIAGKHRQGPVSEAELRRLLATGAANPTDLGWTNGMPAWQELGRIEALQTPGDDASPAPPPEAPAAPPPQPATPTPPVFILPPRAPTPGAARVALPEGLTGWMQYCGVMYIVLGALATLTCVGALVGVPMLIAGTALTAARSLLRDVKDLPAELLPFFAKLKTFVIAIGAIMILYTLGLVLSLFNLVGLLALFGSIARNTAP